MLVPSLIRDASLHAAEGILIRVTMGCILVTSALFYVLIVRAAMYVLFSSYNRNAIIAFVSFCQLGIVWTQPQTRIWALDLETTEGALGKYSIDVGAVIAPAFAATLALSFPLKHYLGVSSTVLEESSGFFAGLTSFAEVVSGRVQDRYFVGPGLAALNWSVFVIAWLYAKAHIRRRFSTGLEPLLGDELGVLLHQETRNGQGERLRS